MEIILSANVFLELLAQGAGEFNDFAAVEAQEMLMLGCWLHLKVVVLFGEMTLFYQPQFLKKLQIPVDCGKANPSMFLSRPEIQLIGIQMPVALAKKLKE